jgi:hypothetical protein
MNISIQTEGRRTYLTGDTYPLRDRLRAIGAHWDPERKAWWTAKREEAAKLVASVASTQSSDAPRDGLFSLVVARVRYHGHAYYLAGRSDGQPVTTKDGSRSLLYFRDGSKQFWASSSELMIISAYQTPRSINELRAFAAAVQAQQEPDECWACKKFCTCASGFCRHHHDGCDVCGADH